MYKKIYIGIYSELLKDIHKNSEKILIIDEFGPWGGVTEFGEIPRRALLELSKGPGSFPSFIGRVRLRRQKVKNKLSEDFWEKYGADFIKGKPEKVGENSVVLDGKKIEAEKVIKSSTKFSDSEKEFFNLTTIPGSVAIIGGGKKAVEFAEAFSNAKIPVTIFTNEILADFSDSVIKWYKNYTNDIGIKIVEKSQFNKNDFPIFIETLEKNNDTKIKLNWDIISGGNTLGESIKIPLEDNIIANISAQESGFIELFFSENKVLVGYNIIAKDSENIDYIMDDLIKRGALKSEIKNLDFDTFSILKSLNEKL